VGIHDELYVEATLPDAAVPSGVLFETKAFPAPFLFRYRITKAGRLIDALGRDLECDGFLEFYYYLDRSAQDLRCVEYRAHFCDGQLKNIVRVDEEADAADKRVYGLASFRLFADPARSGFESEE
jgi:hypothetical protein